MKTILAILLSLAPALAFAQGNHGGDYTVSVWIEYQYGEVTEEGFECFHAAYWPSGEWREVEANYYGCNVTTLERRNGTPRPYFTDYWVPWELHFQLTPNGWMEVVASCREIHNSHYYHREYWCLSDRWYIFASDFG